MRWEKTQSRKVYGIPGKRKSVSRRELSFEVRLLPRGLEGGGSEGFDDIDRPVTLARGFRALAEIQR